MSEKWRNKCDAHADDPENRPDRDKWGDEEIRNDSEQCDRLKIRENNRHRDERC